MMTHDHRKLGVECNNRTWDLIDQGTRTPVEDREMLAAAHASYLHWSKAGTPVNLQRAETAIARVYAALGRLEPALHHLRLAERLAKDHATALGTFDMAMVEAVAARTYALAENAVQAELCYANARRLGDALGEDDRRVFFADLVQPPWFGFSPRSRE
jgi:hypothetical protein